MSKHHDFDPLLAFRVLKRKGVKFLVIGGLAGRLMGSPTVTNDLDICYERDEKNFERLAAALTELKAKLRDVNEDAAFILDAETFKRSDAFTFTTLAGSLDCFGVPSGTDGYADLYANSSQMDLGGVIVRVVSINDLVRMKRASGRPKDRIELEVLGALRDELEQ